MRYAQIVMGPAGSGKVTLQHSVLSYGIGSEDAGLKPLCPPLYNILKYNFCFRSR